jgi:hypothetical protein
LSVIPDIRGPLCASVAVLGLVLSACTTEPPVEPEVRWFFVRDANQRAILAVEAETDGSFDLDLQGAWTVTVTGPYSVQVAGPGRMEVRDRSFEWDGRDLTDRVTNRVASRGKCSYVRLDGAVYEDLPFR